jgi:uncharacterized protein YifN (PemK superfamily)
MVKRRHALVLSVQGMMVTVVPFSTVEPTHLRNFHLYIAADTYPFFAAGAENWLKGDMVTAVSRGRLDRVWYDGRHQRASLTADDFGKARGCVLHALGLGKLVPHL